MDGTHWDDGRIDGGITVCVGSDTVLGSARVRELAAVLIQAPDELDRLTRTPGTNQV
ncbi:hypothetical protein C8E89_10196 [Mycolicibacterium moriokaense]|uniref:Uncharacterized protein n=2 Tax=Mycolicibacterium moriokaense TaxID=39691 RepID=A0A318HMS8_9MYCO|nr:hypothetical protein C8E89_10196 [Mycolicibacterium moriokaense]